MTTAVIKKQRGIRHISVLKKIIARWLYKVEWLKEEFHKRDEAKGEAKVWKHTIHCPSCQREILAISQFCQYCRLWLDEEEARRSGSLHDTNSLYSIKVGQTQYPIQLHGRRLFRVWMEDVRPLINDEDRWLRE